MYNFQLNLDFFFKKAIRYIFETVGEIYKWTICNTQNKYIIYQYMLGIKMILWLWRRISFFLVKSVLQIQE